MLCSKRIILLFALCLPLFVFAKDIDKEQLVKYGCQAYKMRTGVAMQQKAAMPAVNRVQYVEENGQTLMAVINFEGNGFIIMSADDAALPVLGYSTEGSFDLDSVAPAALYWLDYLKEQLMDVKRNNLSADAQIASAWQTVMTGKTATADTKGYETAVPPLVSAHWNQNKFYNYLCPMDNNAPSSYDSHVPCGCVALAMAMIMYYYGYPLVGSGFNSYTSNYGTHEVNFAMQNYRYELMQDVLNNYNNEVAKLIYHAGVSVNMDYGPDGSGAYMAICREALVNNFLFSQDAELVYRNRLNTMTWTSNLKAMLDAKQPILYSGCNSEGCHAFICDGYDTTGLFHFNFGWGGSGDGYFEASKLNSGVGDYHSQQAIIKNLYPRSNIYPTYCTSSKTISAVAGTLSDGSGIYDYQNNQNCTFVIAPPDAMRFRFKVLEMSTEEGQDSVSFWLGHPSKGQLVKTLSGNDCAGQQVEVIGDTAYVTFKTNSSVTSDGWRISFNVDREVIMCVNNKLMLNETDTISDGSGDRKYASNTMCSWLIYPRKGNGIKVEFLKMDISPEDFVAIYDVHASPSVLLDLYTGTTLPQTKVYAYKRVKVIFCSDNYMEGDGFRLVYTAVDDVKIEDSKNLTSQINLYPNPAENQVAVILPEQWAGACELALYDMTGKLLKSAVSEAGAEIQFNVAEIPAGFYILKVVHEGTVVSKKLIIQK